MKNINILVITLILAWCIFPAVVIAAPTVNAGLDQTIDFLSGQPNATAHLDAIVVDDGTTTQMVWSVTRRPPSGTATFTQTTFTPGSEPDTDVSLSRTGYYTLTLTATYLDALGVSRTISDTVIIRVKGGPGVNQSPVSVNKTIEAHQNVPQSLVLYVSDYDEDPLDIEIISQPAHGRINTIGNNHHYDLTYLGINYTSDADYSGQDSFSYRVSDDGGLASGIAIATLNVVVPSVDSWVPPLGIPRPEFGIKETYRMYDDLSKRNPAFTYTQNAEGGYYTHYVDNASPAATDTGNTYGIQDRPRLTVPVNLPEGSVVEIHGGPYSYGGVSGDYHQIDFTATGTQQRPVFIRGLESSIPTFYQTTIRTNSVYLIVENLNLDYSKIGTHYPFPSHHISFRNLEVHGSPAPVGGAAIGAGNGNHTNIVVYNCYIHDNGDPHWPEENDFHAVLVGTRTSPDHSEYVWVLDNHMHGNGGDSTQINSQPDNLVGHVYIGRNLMHEEGENAIDLKECHDVVASENIVYGFTEGAGSDGTAIVINDDPPKENVWILNNKVYNSDNGIRFQAPAYIIGNTVYNCGGSGLYGWGSNVIASIIGNTVYNVNRGIAWGGGVDGNTWVNIENNLISNVSGLYVYIERPYVAEDSAMNNNLLYNPNGPALLSWGWNTDGHSETLAQFQARTGKGPGCVELNPLFIDAANGNLNLQSGSPAIDAGIDLDVYQTFYNLYGIDIRKDTKGTIRPQGSAWDIGAYEYHPDSGTIMYGDVSGDSEISAYDAALTAQASVGIITLTVEQTQKADVNGDAEVSAYDAALIAQRAVGLIVKFPVEG